MTALSAVDRLFLEAAIRFAQPAIFHTSPNPAVGCLLVRGHRVIGRGRTEPAGGRHAEIVALADARSQGESPAGATAYVSLEPCAFYGRTPPCSQALVDAGVTRVVGALTDPHPRVSGAGYAQLEAAGVQVDRYELAEARDALQGFVQRLTLGRPWIRLKVGASLDGRTAMASGESQWITGTTSRSDVQYWRARACAVLTGSGTVLADDPALTVRDRRYARGDWLRQPLRVVLDRAGRVDAAAQVFADPSTSLWLTTTPVDPSRVVPTVLPVAENTAFLEAVVAELASRGCNEVLVEAGPTLTGAFLDAGLWDELLLYQAPMLLGADARPLAQLTRRRLADAVRGTMVDYRESGGDLRIRVRRTDSLSETPRRADEQEGEQR